jgi:MFS family permease
VGCVFHFVPPILPSVIEDLGITHGQAGLLMSLFALPGALLSLSGGWLADRYGERAVGSLGLAVMGAGTLLLGAAGSFPLILAGRTLSGIGMLVTVISLQRMVTRLFQGRPLGVPMGVSGSAIPLGIIIVLNLAGPLAEEHGWREVPFRVGLAVLGIAVVFLIASWFITRGRSLGIDPEGAAVIPTADEESARRKGFQAIWILGAIWFCANGAMTAFMTFAPDHYLDLGLGIKARGVMTSIPMWASALLGPFTGWLVDRHGGRAAFVAWGMGLMGICLTQVPLGSVPPPLIGLGLGIALAAMVTPTMSLPGMLLPPSHIGRGFGILSMCANLGIFAVPPVAGFVRDTSGGYLWPFMLMGGVALLGVAGAEILRRGGFTPGFKMRLVAEPTRNVIGRNSDT